jgi:Cdc6-like AAA superfamily ATPase
MASEPDLLKKYGFKNYPFPISPIEEYAFWADLKKVKEQIEQIFRLAISVPASTSALLWGGRGAGKTYSMNYFMKVKEIEEMLKERKLSLITIKLPISIYITTESYKALYRGIIDALRMNLKQLFSEVSEAYREKLPAVGSLRSKFKTELKYFSMNETLQNIISEWFEDIIFNRRRDEEENVKILKLEAKKKIFTEDDIQSIVSTLFNFIVHSETLRDLIGKRVKIILWLDEWECIRDIRIIENKKINDFLRYLIDYVPSDFVLLINVTLRPDEESADIPAYFTHQLLNRIGKFIEFPPLTANDIFEYVFERINYNLIDRSKECSPFTKESIEATIRILMEANKPVLPRDLNRVFSTILFEAFYENVDKIDSEFIRRKEDLIKAFL